MITAGKNNTVRGFLFMLISAVFIMPYISSCGKAASSSSAGLNIQLQVLNLSPDVHPVNLYLNFVKQNSSPFYYPSSSGYFYLATIDTPLQIRSASTLTTNLLSISQPGFKSNSKYTLFVSGQYSTDSTVTAILTRDDSTAIPKNGFGKIRFVNMSIYNSTLDVTANGSLAFSKVGYEQVSQYIQVPAGNYAFQVYPTNSPATILSTTLGTTTVQDGRLYTLYGYGIVGRTDTSAFNAGVLTNR